MPHTDTRKQVKAEIIRTMVEAENEGTCPLAAAEADFPGIPDMVLGECYAEMSMEQEEAWWDSIERTIDGEVIRNAISTAGTR